MNHNEWLLNTDSINAIFIVAVALVIIGIVINVLLILAIFRMDSNIDDIKKILEAKFKD